MKSTKFNSQLKHYVGVTFFIVTYLVTFGILNYQKSLLNVVLGPLTEKSSIFFGGYWGSK